MSYIIVAEFDPESEVNAKNGLELLSKMPGIGVMDWLLPDRPPGIKADGNAGVEVRGDFLNSKEITRNLCNQLIDAGILQFEIRHSY